VTSKEAKQAVIALMQFGMCDDADEAAHFLVDAGEIDSSQHAELLSPSEATRIYG
jgi:hypothetical protein